MRNLAAGRRGSPASRGSGKRRDDGAFENALEGFQGILKIALHGAGNAGRVDRVRGDGSALAGNAKPPAQAALPVSAAVVLHSGLSYKSFIKY